MRVHDKNFAVPDLVRKDAVFSAKRLLKRASRATGDESR